MIPILIDMEFFGLLLLVLVIILLIMNKLIDFVLFYKNFANLISLESNYSAELADWEEKAHMNAK